jgi:hypothetical protein
MRDFEHTHPHSKLKNVSIAFDNQAGALQVAEAFMLVGALG